MITRISIVPFDFGGTDYERCRAAVAENGFVESPHFGESDRRLIGLSVSRWDKGEELSIYIEGRGFGVVVEREHTEDDLESHGAIARMLVKRQQIHNRIRNDLHPIANLVHDLRCEIQPAKGSRFRRVPPTRWNVWDGIPYVLTFFVDENVDPSALSERAIQSVQALSEPSGIGCGDNDPIPSAGVESVGGIVTQIRALPSNRDDLRDEDVNDAVYCIATWAGLVVLGRDGEPGSTNHTYELMEIRTQIAWSASYYVRRWCERNQAADRIVGSGTVEDLRWQVVPLLQEVVHLSDAGLSTRHRNILKALNRTSELEREVVSTEDALRRLSQLAARRERKRRRRYEGVVELLLGVIALLQIASLIHSGPLVSLSTPMASTVVLIGALVIGVGIVVSRR